MYFLKKLIPDKIKDLFWINFKKLYYPIYYKNFDFYKTHNYKLFNLNFFSPKTIENKNLLKRTLEKYSNEAMFNTPNGKGPSDLTKFVKDEALDEMVVSGVM